MNTQSLDVTFTSLSQLSRAYGAPAVDLAARIVHQAAVGQIGFGVGGAIAFVVLISTAVTLGRWGSDNFDSGWSFVAIIGASATGLASIGCLVSAGVFLTDIWAWTALTDPRFALAHQVFGSMGGQ